MSVLDFQSDHFNLEELADGVYAAIHKPGGGAFSNAGLVDLGGKALVFDTFDSPLPAQDLLHASKELIGLEPEFVVLSHWHGDHWGGIQVFAEKAQVISTEETRNNILKRSVPQLEKLLEDPSPIDSYIAEREEQYEQETDPEQKAILKSTLASLRYRRESMEVREIAVPNQTFEQEMEFIGSRRRVVLRCPGGGHTTSDSVLYLPEDQIAFIGDLGFFREHAFMGYSRPEEWLSLLGDLEESEYQVFVPGHGPVGPVEDVRLSKQYIQALIDTVKKMIRSGGTAEIAAVVPPPAPFDEWSGGLRRYPTSMQYLFERYS